MSSPLQPSVAVGLDIGGANTKAAIVDGDGRVRVASEPFEVWRRPDALTGAIASVVGRLGAEGAPVALTTTAELVDAFGTKREGVLHVLDAARSALAGRDLRVITTDGELIAFEEARAAPLRCAAANWMATALLIARSSPDAILLDCGGTTTDVIPILGGDVVARGRTDVERLLSGELVYTGALRTNVAAIVSHVPIGGRALPGLVRAVRDQRRRASAPGQPDPRGMHLHVSRRARRLAPRGAGPAGARRVRRP